MNDVIMPAKLLIINDELFCHKCKITKNISEFYPYKDTYKRPCIECKIEYQKHFYVENKEDIEIYRKEYYLENKDLIIEKQTIRDFERREEIKIYKRKYESENRLILNEKKRLYKKRVYEEDPSKKIRRSLSGSIFSAMKENNSCKNNISFLKFLPYTIQELKNHLQSLFEPWMTWKNRGLYRLNEWDDNDSSTWKWQVDHIIPHSTFKYTSMEDQSFKDCWALSNLRPYSAKQNVIDGIRKRYIIK